jgi:predicted negative regulator of RcsB-dependent stress response
MELNALKKYSKEQVKQMASKAVIWLAVIGITFLVGYNWGQAIEKRETDKKVTIQETLEELLKK